MKIAMEQFKGIAPRYAPKMIPDGMGQIAQDCSLSGGKLRPLRGMTEEGASVADCTKSIYLWKYDYWEMTFTGGSGTWSTITNGIMKFKLERENVEITGLDFSEGDPADILQEAIREKTLSKDTFIATVDGFVWRSTLELGIYDDESSDSASDSVVYEPIDGLLGIATVEKNRHREWFYWCDHTPVINSPIYDDTLARFYYIDAETGKMRYRGIHGDREVSIPAPGDKRYGGGIVSIQSIPLWHAVANKLIDPQESQWYNYVTDIPSSAVSKGADLMKLTVESHEFGPVEDDDLVSYDGMKITLKYNGYCITGTLTQSCFGVTWFSIGDTEYPVDINCSSEQFDIKVPIYDKNDVYVGSFRIIASEQLSTIPAPECPEGTTSSESGWIREYSMGMDYSDEYTNGIKQDLFYIIRYVTDVGEEGIPSEVSDMVARDPGADIVLTMAVPEGLPSYITKKRIYRSAGTLADSGFYFLDEVDVNETTYIDDKFDSQLVEQMPNFGNPVDGMKDLVLCTNGFVAGFRGKDVYFSDPNLPHQWPWKYRMTVGDEIVGMAVRRNTLQVMTVSNLWALIGNYPDEMTAVNMKGGQGCINQRGIANVSNTVIYPSPDGLVGTDSGTPQLVTGQLLRKIDWEKFDAENWTATEYDGSYFAFNEDSGFVLNLTEGNLTTLSIGAQAVFYDAEEDTLFLVRGESGEEDVSDSTSTSTSDSTSNSEIIGTTRIYKWDKDEAFLAPAIWCSKEFELDRPQNFSAARIMSRDISADNPVIVDIYSKGEYRGSMTVTTEDAVRMPRLRDERDWHFKITAPIQVDALHISESMAEV